MKKTFIAIVCACFVAAGVLTGCNSAQNNGADAEAVDSLGVATDTIAVDSDTLVVAPDSVVVAE